MERESVPNDEGDVKGPCLVLVCAYSKKDAGSLPWPVERSERYFRLEALLSLSLSFSVSFSPLSISLFFSLLSSFSPPSSLSFAYSATSSGSRRTTTLSHSQALYKTRSPELSVHQTVPSRLAQQSKRTW